MLQHVRLVEVTSNIWGTKFKIHGLANSVPANLGQVTYKTSLLHLQPRQMTLVMTELRDDFPVGPDPTFNPNLFSEDEEEQCVDEKSKFRKVSIDNCPPIAPMSPRGNRLNRPKSQLTGNYLPGDTSLNSRPIPVLAKAESYEEEFPYLEITDAGNFCETIRPHSLSNGPICTQPSLRATNSSQSTSFVGQYNRNGTTSVTSQRHAISPLCCESSVPALQSPKNAVAPSDIIFDRPPAQTLISYSAADYSITSNNVQQVKANLIGEQRNGISLSLNPSGDSHKNFLVKKIEMESNNKLNHSNELSINSKNTLVDSAKLKEGKTSPNGNQIGVTSKEILFIDDEHNMEAAGPSSGPRPTLPLSIADSMVRSCSVGYLDVMEIQMLPSEVALMMIRKDAPKRLVLVNKKIKQKKHGRKYPPDRENRTSLKSPKLKNCRKSKSLDSSDMFSASETNVIKKEPKEEIIPEIVAENNIHSKTEDNTAATVTQSENNINNNINNTINKKDNRLNFFTSKSPLIKRKKPDNSLNNTIENCNKSRSRSKQKNSTKTNIDDSSSTNLANSRTGMFLHNHALATLENLLTRLRDDDNRATPPPSPRLPRSSPSSPAPSKKGI